MKFNQFSRVNADYRTQVSELQGIGFLNQLVTPQTSLNELWLSFVYKSFPQAQSQSSLKEMNFLLASPTENVLDYIDQHTVDAAAFSIGLSYLDLLVVMILQQAPLDSMKQFNLLYHDKITDVPDLIGACMIAEHSRQKRTKSVGYFSCSRLLPTIMTCRPHKPLLFNGKSQPVFSTDELIRSRLLNLV